MEAALARFQSFQSFLELAVQINRLIGRTAAQLDQERWATAGSECMSVQTVAEMLLLLLQPLLLLTVHNN